MPDNFTINQKAALGSETTQIAQQTNNYGLTPIEASQLAIDLFMNNFPKLQADAMNVVQARVDQLIKEIVSKIEETPTKDYSAFSTPDMQYILVEAEKGYARKGTKELCDMLSSLIADRSKCKSNSYLEIILDKAIELAPTLLPIHLNYISLIFLYKNVHLGKLKTLEDIKDFFSEAHNLFPVPSIGNMISHLNMLGIFTLTLEAPEELMAQTYGFNVEEIKKNIPSEYSNIPTDYGLTPVGIVLAIFNIQLKTPLRFNIQQWIKE